MSDGDRAAPNGLDDCGCCEGIAPSTPSSVYNRPALSQVSYRSDALAQALREYGYADTLHGTESAARWATATPSAPSTGRLTSSAPR